MPPLSTPPDPVVAALSAASLLQLIEEILSRDEATNEVLINQLDLGETFRAHEDDMRRLADIETDLPYLVEAISEGRSRDALDMLYNFAPHLMQHPDCVMSRRRVAA
jgi:hypothetical protein